MHIVLSAINETELKNIHLWRNHKPIVLGYGVILKTERVKQKVFVGDLQSRLKEHGFERHTRTICRWEIGYVHPDLNIVEAWANCLGLKASVSLYADDRRLLGDTYQESLSLLRKDKDIHLCDVSKQIGITKDKLRDWERAKKYPNEPDLKAWAIALGIEAQLVIERG